MCGIAGLVGAVDRVSATDAVSRMTRSLAHRGPDGEGLFAWDEAVFGHRRLAIFDLSDAGRQPMVSPDGRLGVVFNGAIYNFLDLRRELLARGYSFHSNTDTEVLIHGYREWGIDGLVSRLRGMFAIGLWDDQRRRLFLIRDRLGVKPLVYAERNGRFAFASTVRALRDGGFADEVDEKAIAEFLEFGFVTDGRSIYKGVSKVPAATIVEWSGGALRAREYWSPPSVSEPAGVSFDEAVEATEALFLRAVEKRLQADVPVGALLSGGIDSSLVCWAVARLGGDVKAYTVGTPGDPWDESADARATAATLKIEHQVLEMSATDATGVGELVAAYGEPFACASALGMLAVSRTVAPSATVLLTGDGGDDVFLGYPEHRNFWLAERTARVTPTAAIEWWPAYRQNFPQLLRRGRLRRAASFFDYVSGGLGAVTRARDGFPMYQRHGMVGDRLADVVIEQRTIGWSHESAKRLLGEFLQYDRRMRFVGEYLTKVDGATMHHGLEARSPFLDQELWEFAATLPFDLRMYRGRLKAILRELARRKMGERVADGKKRGFGIPVQRWITGRWRSSVEAALRNSRLEEEGWIRSGPVLAQLELAAQKQWAPNQLWYLFVLESWLRHERERELSPPQPSQTVGGQPGGVAMALNALPK